MSQQDYSAHPALAAEQLKRAELEVCSRQVTTTTTMTLPSITTTLPHVPQSATSSSSRRHAKATPKKYTNSRSCAAHVSKAQAQPQTAATTRHSSSNNKGIKESVMDVDVVSPCTTRKTRTNYATIDDDDDIDGDDVDDVNFGKLANEEIKIIRHKTKDCVSNTQTITQKQRAEPQHPRQAAAACSAAASIDEPDHVQQRFKRHNSDSRQTQHQLDGGGVVGKVVGIVTDSISDLSSVMSTPSDSTVSSPLSTPTRQTPLQVQQHCCQKGAAALATTESRARQQHTHQPQHSHHHHQNHHSHLTAPHHLQQQYHHQQQHTAPVGGGMGGLNSSSLASSTLGAGGCKNKKLDPRFSQSPYRQLVPIALCLISFATVFATLIVYMDTTEIRHQQFRLNMSRDYELNSVAQDDPALIAFLRQIHMRKYPLHPSKGGTTVVKTPGMPVGMATLGAEPPYISAHGNINGSSGGVDELASAMAHYVADLLVGKLNGAVIQSLTGPLAHFITAPWFSEQLHWTGVLVEPEPRCYFTLRKQNAQRTRMQVVHACVSPNPYPKEITIHNEDVRINSLHDEETSWFNSRVKCFPLYTIMLACERTEYDLLSLGVQGHELEILQTLPFDKVKIEIISIHLLEDHEDVGDYVQSITKFLAGKSYKLQRKFGRNYFYQRLKASSRTRKKDILLLKTP